MVAGIVEGDEISKLVATVVAHAVGVTVTVVGTSRPGGTAVALAAEAIVTGVAIWKLAATVAALVAVEIVAVVVTLKLAAMVVGPAVAVTVILDVI